MKIIIQIIVMDILKIVNHFYSIVMIYKMFQIVLNLNIYSLQNVKVYINYQMIKLNILNNQNYK